ncbi:MAG: PLP-dependent transferase, partial [Verrucomicrobiota bacterium]
KGEAPAGVFCEIPSNPQLRTADLAGLRSLLDPQGIPLIVDDTIATIFNVDCFEHADVVTTSLTKFISGTGDVLGGSLILNRKSPIYAELSKLMREDHVDDLYPSDALILFRNATNFAERMPIINETTVALTDFLSTHPAIAEVWYPKMVTPEFYDAIRRDGGGYGGIFSILLQDPTKTAQAFFDRLRVSKGPSLGTNFTLACPYMFLAHYPELDWCDDLGINRWLVRVSVGLEDPDDLIQRFDSALKS